VSRARDFSTRPAASRADLGLLLAAAVVLGLGAQQALAARAARDAARERAAEARRTLSALRERLPGSGTTSGESGLSARALAARSATPGTVLADLAALLPPDVRLDRLDLAYGAAVTVDAQVVARAPRAYDLFLERLARSPRFHAVQPGTERREGELRVSVRAAYRPEAAP
jgi:hypothetical protein